MIADDQFQDLPDDPLHTIAVSVGNTTAKIGLLRGDEVLEVRRIAAHDTPTIAHAVEELAARVWDEPRRAIVIASVNDPAADPLIDAIRDAHPTGVFRLGEDLDIPIITDVEPGYTPGQDRLLNALGAFNLRKSACVVVDAGTAITVDFVDGEGVFVGGAIAPGLRLSLDALHRGTAALPLVDLAPPGAAPYGRSTKEAILSGVVHGARGMVRLLLERYAEAYGAYPPVIATGGDAHLLFDNDELIDAIIDDLTIRGIAAACAAALADVDDE
jgi:type III pantothenate kinase